jgi:hypothetical protein
MLLKPQDVVAAVWVGLRGQGGWSFQDLASGLGISASQVHQAVRSALKAELLRPQLPTLDRLPVVPVMANLLEFLIHGVRYAFPPVRAGLTRGIPTSFAAPVFGGRIKGDPLPVWPHPFGKVRGEAFSPLYKTVPEMALRDPLLYDAFALIDAIRGGAARERAHAIAQLPRLPWPGKR